MSECKRCGRCCEMVMIRMPIVTDPSSGFEEWITSHEFIEVMDDRAMAREGRASKILIIHSPCKHLGYELCEDKENVRAVCAIHGTKPRMCKDHYSCTESEEFIKYWKNRDKKVK